MPPFFATKPTEETIPQQGALGACWGMGLLQGDNLNDLFKLSVYLAFSVQDGKHFSVELDGALVGSQLLRHFILVGSITIGGQFNQYDFLLCDRESRVYGKKSILCFQIACDKGHILKRS
jgi:hypothetical protein